MRPLAVLVGVRRPGRVSDGRILKLTPEPTGRHVVNWLPGSDAAALCAIAEGLSPLRAGGRNSLDSLHRL
jgi:hypothetical protein